MSSPSTSRPIALQSSYCSVRIPRLPSSLNRTSPPSSTVLPSFALQNAKILRLYHVQQLKRASTFVLAYENKILSRSIVKTTKTVSKINTRNETRDHYFLYSKMLQACPEQTIEIRSTAPFLHRPESSFLSEPLRPQASVVTKH